MELASPPLVASLVAPNVAPRLGAGCEEGADDTEGAAVSAGLLNKLGVAPAVDAAGVAGLLNKFGVAPAADAAGAAAGAELPPPRLGAAPSPENNDGVAAVVVAAPGVVAVVVPPVMGELDAGVFPQLKPEAPPVAAPVLEPAGAKRLLVGSAEVEVAGFPPKVKGVAAAGCAEDG